MIDINQAVKDLSEYAVSKKLIDERDRTYAINRIMEVLELQEYSEPEVERSTDRNLDSILEDMRQWAVSNDRVEDDSMDTLDIFDTKIMAQLVKMPSEIEREFYDKYAETPESATSYYYELSKNTNYIRTERVKKDVKWKHKTEYGEIDITINLSKPEKDPRAIAKAKLLKSLSYPKCMLCIENEGYSGRPSYPARGNHRVIGIELTGERWFLQYSPYTYYNEHCIIFKEKHEPMKITKLSFERLLEFVQKFPHYFIGSNADLPIVGGSILSHDHFQGGNYTFAMAEAKEENYLELKNGIESCTLKWPMSVIRLKGQNVECLADAAYDILLKWKQYSDEDVNILSHTAGEEHNTITPICRFRNGKFELDLVLRNNRTTDESPYGIFHPREEYHHIKKENIGLIEVMGLAVLPARLKKEMEMLRDYLLKNDREGIKNNEELSKHFSWAETLVSKYGFNNDNINDIIDYEIAEVFLGVLKDAGVFKDDQAGKNAFKKCRIALFSGLNK